MQRLQSDIRCRRHDLQKRCRWPCRSTALLLPILQRADAHMHQTGEFALAQSNALANALDVGRVDLELPRWTNLTLGDSGSLLEACHQFGEQLLFHLTTPSPSDAGSLSR